MSRPYRPSNGTEGMIFYSSWCETCVLEGEKRHCSIYARSFLYYIGHKDYPKEWVYGESRRPICTAHRTTWKREDSEPKEAGPLLVRMGEPE